MFFQPIGLTLHSSAFGLSPSTQRNIEPALSIECEVSQGWSDFGVESSGFLETASWLQVPGAVLAQRGTCLLSVGRMQGCLVLQGELANLSLGSMLSVMLILIQFKPGCKRTL